MWKCKKCGAEVIAEAEIYTTADFHIDDDGCITNPTSGFTLEDIVRDGVEDKYFHCTKCNSYTETPEIEDLEKIAYWEED